MKKALILYYHGLGDIIQLTPHLRELYRLGYITDIMCNTSVRKSHLLDNCPYVNMIIDIENPWWSKIGFEKQLQLNKQQFDDLSSKYDWVGYCPHNNIQQYRSKIDCNSNELNLKIYDRYLEVFIPMNIHKQAIEYIESEYPKGYIHVHTNIELHAAHSWDSMSWINNNLPDLPIVDTGFGGNKFVVHDNINFSFVLAMYATHRVYSSSTFVHAADAMNLPMDIVHYGSNSDYAWPEDRNKIKTYYRTY